MIFGLFLCCDIKVIIFWGIFFFINFFSNFFVKIELSVYRIMIKYVIYKLFYDY